MWWFVYARGRRNMTLVPDPPRNHKRQPHPLSPRMKAKKR